MKSLNCQQPVAINRCQCAHDAQIGIIVARSIIKINEINYRIRSSNFKSHSAASLSAFTNCAYYKARN